MKKDPVWFLINNIWVTAKDCTGIYLVKIFYKLQSINYFIAVY